MPLIFEDMAPDDAAVYLPNTDLPIIFWRNVITTDLLGGASQHPDFPISNLANPSLALKWKQDYEGSPVTRPISIDFTAFQHGNVNYFAIAGHNFGTIGATISLTIDSGEGEGSPLHQESPSSAQVIGGFIPEDNSPIIMMFAELESPNVLRLFINNPSATTPAEAAVVYYGSSTTLPEGIQADHTPLPLAKRNDVVLGTSENGSFLGRIVLGTWAESSATISNLTKAWVREELLDFLDFASEFPFFYAWSPLTYPEETAFAFLDNDPLPLFDVDGFATVDLAMKGIIE